MFYTCMWEKKIYKAEKLSNIAAKLKDCTKDLLLNRFRKRTSSSQLLKRE